ncbi:hypothetical protein CIB84_011694, partial [Bambusicola thoracicus]
HGGGPPWQRRRAHGIGSTYGGQPDGIESTSIGTDWPSLHRCQANEEEVTPQMSLQGHQDPYTSRKTAASTLVLILPSCRLALTQESSSSRPSWGLTWSLHFLVILFTAKAPMSPSFLPPSLVLSQILSSLLHQVLRKRAAQGLPSSELLCRGSGTSPAEGPQTSQGCKDPPKLP